jgi:hypothetical protein
MNGILSKVVDNYAGVINNGKAGAGEEEEHGGH